MIKFMMSKGNREVLGLILTKGNLDYLQKDMPIHFNAEDMKLKEIKVNEILICYFETEEEAKEYFFKGGFISEETIVHEVSKEKH